MMEISMRVLIGSRRRFKCCAKSPLHKKECQREGARKGGLIVRKAYEQEP